MKRYNLITQKVEAEDGTFVYYDEVEPLIKAAMDVVIEAQICWARNERLQVAAAKSSCQYRGPIAPCRSLEKLATLSAALERLK